MRKGYLIVAAVATSFLASCSNERVLNERQDNDAVIRFESYAERSTKAPGSEDLTLEFFHNTFSVYSTKKDQENNIVTVFGESEQSVGTTCTYTGNNNNTFHGSNWRYDDERYWDKNADYNIIACAPNNATISPLRYVYTSTNEVAPVGTDGSDFIVDNYYLTGKNLQQSQPKEDLILTGFNVKGEDLDLMTSEIRQCKGIEQYNSPVDFNFHHILSKLNVKILKLIDAKGLTVIVDSVMISGLKDMGSYKESLFDNTTNNFTGIITRESGWTPADANNDPNYVISYKAEGNLATLSLPEPESTIDETTNTEHITLNPLYYIESLTIPQALTDNAKIKLVYHIVSKLPGGRDESFTFIKPLKEIFKDDPVFFDRYSYTIECKLDIKAVIFNVKTDKWIEQKEDVNVNPQG